MAVDRNFMTYIIGNHLYAAAVFIVLASGAIMFFVSFLGCCSVVKEQRFLLYVVSVITRHCSYFLSLVLYYIDVHEKTVNITIVLLIKAMLTSITCDLQ